MGVASVPSTYTLQCRTSQASAPSGRDRAGVAEKLYTYFLQYRMAGRQWDPHSEGGGGDVHLLSATPNKSDISATRASRGWGRGGASTYFLPRRTGGRQRDPHGEG